MAATLRRLALPALLLAGSPLASALGCANLPRASNSSSSSSSSSSGSTGVVRQECSGTKKQIKPWTSLTADEKAAYLAAENCLMARPTDPALNITGAQNRWDDLHYVHIIQSNFVHSVGQFLPFHRYYMVVHQNLLIDECDYTGPFPYWNETADVDNLAGSPLFFADGFGGNGAAAAASNASSSSSSNCVADGPFANATLHLKRLGDDPQVEDYCISRNFTQSAFSPDAGAAAVDECLAYQNYTGMLDCLSTGPHGAGHNGVSGVMGDIVLSPGDPLFYMHHTWLDVLFWKWQAADLDTRLTDMGGNNIPSDMILEGTDLPYPLPAFTDYDGDPGNTTTLNHTLFVLEIYPNATVGEVMDIAGETVCADYTYDVEW